MAVSYARSGQITVTTAGTEVAGPDVPGQTFAIKAHPNNTDTVWVGNVGSGVVASTTGYPLNPGEAVPVDVANLSLLMFDADVSGEKVCWLRLA
jgi:hypothetical protein